MQIGHSMHLKTAAILAQSLQTRLNSDGRIESRTAKGTGSAFLRRYGREAHHVAARTLAAFWGGFTLLNLIGAAMHPGFDATVWWLDLRALPLWSERGLQIIVAGILLLYAARPRQGRIGRLFTAACILGIMAVSLLNMGTYASLLLAERITTGVPIPFSLLVLFTLAVILTDVLRSRSTSKSSHAPRFFRITTASATLFVCVVGFPLAWMYCFGKTDYRRPADAIIVFGARAYADGRCSDALRDRVRTACTLYEEGLAPRLVFSGGPGDGEVHETEAMTRLAVDLGVPRSAIIQDRQGLNTQATVRNSASIFERHRFERILAVSHFYHLPRVKMCYRREGFNVYTVPAKEEYTLTMLPYNLAREVAAFWVYYLRPLS